ncbi:MAG: DUF2252 family protein [Gemmatimonadetes bacterium]|nr:DUF2252 family protein [Gemmatimonadota bacterium]
MAASPFSFYRGSCQLFFDAWPARSPLDRTPAVWGCGDLHFENFGSFKGDNRLVYFDLNDFDECALVPAAWEVTRFAASVIVGAKAIDVSAAEAVRLARAYVDEYATALSTGKARWVERDTATGRTRALLDAVRTRKRRKLLDRRTKGSGAKRRLRIDGVKTLPVSRAERALAIRLVRMAARARGSASGATAALDPRRYFSVLDVARRIAGTGSLGLARWVVLVDGRGGADGQYLLDVKEARPSAPAPRSPYRQPTWPHDAARIVEVQRRVQVVAPALLYALRAGKRSFVLKELQPTADRLQLEDWRGDLDDLRGAMTTMAELTAWGQLRASGRGGSATADELIAFAAAGAWKRAVLDMAKRVAATTMTEWATFRNAQGVTP